MHLKKILTLSFLFLPLMGQAFDNSREAPMLTNIKQLTFKHMGVPMLIIPIALKPINANGKSHSTWLKLAI